jgi:hypothetical protein
MNFIIIILIIGKKRVAFLTLSVNICYSQTTQKNNDFVCMTLHSHVALVEHRKRDIMIFIYNPLETNLELILYVWTICYFHSECLFCFFPSNKHNIVSQMKE